METLTLNIFKLRLSPPAEVSTGTMCSVCNILVPNRQMSSHLRTLQHKNKAITPLNDCVHLIGSAMGSRIGGYRILSVSNFNEYTTFFQDVKHRIIELLERAITEHRSLKVNMEVFGRYIQQSDDEVDIKSFNTTNKVVDMGTDLDAIYEAFVDSMITQSSEFTERGSGFRWLSQREIETFKIDDIPNDSDYGFVFEADIKYPEALHDKHADLPFLVESIIPHKQSFTNFSMGLSRRNSVIKLLCCIQIQISS